MSTFVVFSGSLLGRPLVRKRIASASGIPLRKVLAVRSFPRLGMPLASGPWHETQVVWNMFLPRAGSPFSARNFCASGETFGPAGAAVGSGAPEPHAATHAATATDTDSTNTERSFIGIYLPCRTNGFLVFDAIRFAQSFVTVARVTMARQCGADFVERHHPGLCVRGERLGEDIGVAARGEHRHASAHR